MDAGAVGSLLASRQWSALIKALDGALAEPEAAKLTLLINRGFCLQQLGLYRKALKDYDAALEVAPGHPGALLNRAKVLVALKQTEEAAESLAELAGGAGLAADLALALEAQQLAAALAAGDVKAGAKVPLLPPPVAPPPPQQPQPQPAKPAASSFAAGFLGAPPKPKAAAAPRAAAEPAAAAPAAAALAPSSSSGSSSTAAAPAAASNGSSAGAGAGAGGGQASSSPPPAVQPAAANLDPLHRLLAVNSPDQGVALAVELVNGGRCAQAAALLDLLLSHHPRSLGALAARGTARALLGALREAEQDFDAAIAMEPRVADFYRRRAQARAALGREEEAAADVRAALALATDDAARADAHEELGRLWQKVKDYRRAEAEFKRAAELAPGGPRGELLGALGLCQVSQGDLEDGIASYEAALALDPDSRDLWLSLGMACKERCDVARAQQALSKAARLAQRGRVAVQARKLLAQMRQGLGDHLGAIRELNRGIAAAEGEAARVELRFLRGACHHALGLHREAVADYGATLDAQAALDPRMPPPPELVSFICLAFYQKEMALYVRDRLDRHVLSFCVDADLHPEFKELWCKKGPPSAAFVSAYRAIMQPQHPNWDAPKPPPPPAEALAPLLTAADAVGRLVQYRHQGFLPNRRQQRMAGLAAIELAQSLQQLAADRRAGRPTLVDSAGASVAARRGPRSGTHPYCWRDAMDVLVRWRQLAEPNDQVIWVDLLTEQEFKSGFGSHTPMFTGQTKCVRYYMVFHRALALMKEVLAREGHATDASNAPVPMDADGRAAAVEAAQTAEQMWRALGADCWVVVPIASTTRPGHTLEGTRLTVVNLSKPPPAATAAGVGAPGAGGDGDGGANGAADAPPRREPDSYELSIRTPVTPARWDDYDEELTGVFESLGAALAARDLPAAADAALRFAYYWYNFMPLARGSALCGLVFLLAAFLAAGAPVRSGMPEHYQTDWEAILEGDPRRFIASVTNWLLPPELRRQQEGEGQQQQQQQQQQEGEGAPPQQQRQQEGEGQQQGQQQQPAAARRQGQGGGGGGQPPDDAPPPCPPVDTLPQVTQLLPTMRARLEALNGDEVPRI